MNHFKKITIGSMIIASLALSACTQEVPNDRNRVANPSASSSSSAKDLEGDRDYTGTQKIKEVPVAPKDATVEDIPTDTDPVEAEIAKNITEQTADKPLNIDIEKSIKEYADPALAETFPEKDFKVAEGVRFALATYQELVQTKNFYDPRDGLQDVDLIAPYMDKFDTNMHKAMTEGIKEKGKAEFIPTALPSGVFAQVNEGDAVVDIIPISMPDSTWGTPSLEVKYEETAGNYINVVGVRRISVSADNGKRYEAIVNYNIGVSPSGDEWLISALGWKLVSLNEVK